MTDPTNRRPDSGNEGDGIPESLQRAWDRLPDPEPPHLVDQAVLNRARTAVEAPHSSRPWSFGWPHALTTAAVIVLAITLVMPLRDTGQPGGDPEGIPRSSGAENRSQDALELEEQMLEEPPSAEPEASFRARREPAPRALAAPALEKADAAPMESAASADAAIATEVESRLQAIRDLMEAGDLAAAREALFSFQQDYPATELPPDLAALLDTPLDEPPR